jgi:hypothetical protein
MTAVIPHLKIRVDARASNKRFIVSMVFLQMDSVKVDYGYAEKPQDGAFPPEIRSRSFPTLPRKRPIWQARLMPEWASLLILAEN